jgi:Transglycosylase SLT domain
MSEYFNKYNRIQLTPAIEARRQQYLPEIQKQAAAAGIPWRLLDMVVAHESMYQTIRGKAPSSSGRAPDEFGITQLRPDTARGLGLRVDKDVDERGDPAKSIGASAKYLAGFYKQSGGDWGLTGVGYNSGTIKGINRGPSAPIYHDYLKAGQTAYQNEVTGRQDPRLFDPASPMYKQAPQPAGDAAIGSMFGISAPQQEPFLMPEQPKLRPNLMDVPPIAHVNYTTKPSDFILNVAFGGDPSRGKRTSFA